MPELKKFSKTHKIHIKLCLTLAKHGFSFLGTNKLDKISGICQECGHHIKYEQVFKDTKYGKEYTIGSECMFKIYIFYHWKDQIDESDIENKHLQRAGKWLWIIHRDNLERIVNDLPQPKDYNRDFKRLLDDLKNLVLKIRGIIKKEIEEEKRKKKKQLRKENRYKEKRVMVKKVREWVVLQGVDIDKCNDWELKFLATMYKAHMKRWSLSKKQEMIFNKIKGKGSLNTKYSVVNNGNKYIGKIIPTWLVKEKTGIEGIGTISYFYRETDLAILCDLMVENSSNEIFKEVWIPKSQILGEISL